MRTLSKTKNGSVALHFTIPKNNINTKNKNYEFIKL